MRFPIFTAAAIALALPAAATARDAPDDGDMAQMAERLSDPAFQAEMALTIHAMGEILLDMPVGPMMGAVAEAGAEIAGERADKIDPDATLRRMAPEAGRLPGKLAKHTPQIMEAMGAAARSMDEMTPALRGIAKRMEEALRKPRD